MNKVFDIPDLSSEGKVYLAFNGESNFKIVIAKNALPAVKTASEELQSYLKKITSFDYPITTDDKKEHEYEIILGKTSRDTEEITTLRENLGEEGYLVKWVGKKLYITGGDEEELTYGRGTLYGVYDFLRSLGCGFYAEDTEIVPEKKEIIMDITSPEIVETPAFEYRDLFWSCSYDEVLSAKLHINGCLMSGTCGRTISKEYGSGLSYAGPHFVHTFAYMVSGDEYFESHPEYFAEINGVRTCENLKSQLCLSNEDVYVIVRDKVREWLKENPTARIVSVSQNDGLVIDTYCTCEKCAAIDKEEGSHAGTIIRFVNRLAKELGEEFPNVAFDTLAYQYSISPTKTEPLDNVIVRYCTGSCISHGISECSNNAGIKNNIINWGKKCDRMYIWNYTTNFANYLFPMMNFDSIQSDLQFFKENGVLGVFEQGMYQEGKSGEFGELRSYIMARLLWDPYDDISAIKKEFMDAYYGEAGDLISEYIDSLTNMIKENDVHVGIVNSIADVYTYRRVTSDMWERYEEIWAKAKEITKDNPLCYEHVERSELSYRMMKKELLMFEFDTGKTEEATSKLYEDMRRLGVVRLNEGATV